MGREPGSLPLFTLGVEKLMPAQPSWAASPLPWGKELSWQRIEVWSKWNKNKDKEMGCNQKEKGVSARVYHWKGGIQGHLGMEDGKLLKSRVLGCWMLSGGGGAFEVCSRFWSILQKEK